MTIDVVIQRGRKPDCVRCRGTGKVIVETQFLEYNELNSCHFVRCMICRGTGIEDPYDGDTWMMDF